MGVGKAIHYVGSALLFIAMVLTIVVDISAPVTNTISFLNFDLPGGADARFGVFGSCWKATENADFECSSSSIGYDAASVIEDISSINFSNARSNSIETLTHILVLHPVGSGLLFLAFLLSLASGSTIVSILAMLVSLVAFIVNAVALVIDFITFRLVRSEVNDALNASASYGPAAWLALVAGVLALVATVILFITCCAGRRSKKRATASRKSMEGGYVDNSHAY